MPALQKLHFNKLFLKPPSESNTNPVTVPEAFRGDIEHHCHAEFWLATTYKMWYI